MSRRDFLESQVHAHALFPQRMLHAVAEGTAGWGIDRRRHVATQELAFTALGRIGDGDRIEQGLGVGVAWVLIKFRGRREFDDLAEIHHGDAVAHVFHDIEAVGDEEITQAHIALQIEQEIEHLALHGDIERGDGFVTDDELGLQCNGARDANALALPTAEFEREAVGRGGAEADFVEQISHPLPPFLRCADLLHDEGLLQNITHSVAWIERLGGILEDHLDVPAHRTQRAHAGVGDVLAFKLNAAAGGIEQTHDRFAERGLAAARFTDEAECLTCAEREAHAIHRFAGGHGTPQQTAAYGEMLLKVLDGEEAHATQMGQFSTQWLAEIST